MIRLAAASVRHRPGSFVGPVVAVALAVAILTSCGVLLESALRTTVPPDRYRSADVVVSGSQSGFSDNEPAPERVRISDRLVGELRATPGVEQVVPDDSIALGIAGTERGSHVASGPGGAPVWGHPWSANVLTPFRLVRGIAPATPDSVVVDATVAHPAGVVVGQMVEVESSAMPAVYRVVGIVEPAIGGPLRHQGAVFFSDDRAAQLAGHPGRVDAVGVRVRAGVDTALVKVRILRLVDRTHADAAVWTGDQRGQAELLDGIKGKSLITIVSSVFGSDVVFVMAFVVAAALGLVVSQRRRELALLRAVAATPRQLRRLIATESLAVALAGSAIGWLPGIAAAAWARRAMVDRGLALDTFRLHVSFVPPIVAGAIAVLVTQAAGLVAARRATRIRPTAALQEAAVERQGPGWFRVVAGIGSIAGAVAIFAVALGQSGNAVVSLALPMLLLLMLAVAFLGPLLARAITAVVGLPLRWIAPAAGHLAAANTRADSRRLAAAITPLVLTIAFGATLVFMQLGMLHGADQQVDDGFVADRVVRTAPVGVPRNLGPQLRALPGVAVSTPTVDSTVVVTNRPPGTAEIDRETFAARGVDPIDFPRTVDLGVDAGHLADLAPGRVAVSDMLAQLTHRHVGEQVWVTLGDKTVRRMTIVAVYRRGLGYGDVTMAYGELAPHVTDPVDSSVLIRFKPGADVAAVDQRLRAVAAAVPGTTVADHDQFASDVRKDQSDNAWLNDVLVAVLVGIIAVAVVNTMVMATNDRSGELRILRLVGATRRQVMRMLGWEALVVTGAGLLIGGGIAALALIPITRGLVGTSTPYVPPLGYVATVGAALALCLPAVLLTARLNLRDTSRQ